MSWWKDDPRYGKRGWTLISDESGSRFVPWPGWYWRDRVLVEPKPKRPPRALRFGDLQAGAILIHRGKIVSEHRVKHPDHIANEDWRTEIQHYASFQVVLFRWFDPVAGQEDRLKGEMAGVVPVTNMGQQSHATPHTLRGLATQGYTYASPDQAERVRAFIEHRRELIADVDAGLITREEARVRAWPYRELIRDL
ncbi:MAG: hypothetical protein ACJ8DZ_13740 [Allosphingosinicella sp.]